MHRITSATAADLFDIAATRRIEQAAATALPAHTLMQRAGLAVARLAMAIAPHARTIWVACGPGNNGGDGFEAAAQLRHRGFFPVVTFAGDESRLPPDARASLQRARDAGVTFAAAPPSSHDLAIDALLGIGSTRPPEGTMAEWLARMHASAQPVLSVDVPSGLNADTGTLPHGADHAQTSPRTCITFLTLKPGLFTAQGRDAAGAVWVDDLGCGAFAKEHAPTARIAGTPAMQPRTHASHKGSYGDVAVIGGASGMAGAALLAGSAALHAGAGRVFVGLLDPSAAPVDVSQPELMLRDAHALDLSGMTAVCGCGGGEAVRDLLPSVLSTAAALVLDADALNAIAADAALQAQLVSRGKSGAPTVLTPHPLEAARLLGCTAGEVQGDRLAAARQLASRFGAVTVLKGSGTVIAGTGNQPPVVNLTGNARLASAGTGDVLAGMVGAALAMRRPPFEAACEAVWQHGHIADTWPADAAPLTAGTLARRAPA
ncbi:MULTISPECIES: NAD(P)H-hydrate dehydratase [unclassified Variovorax]|uniref:NAD(P)H-hydrate dehydratase n=1 Tax=unclassified Variovorax TaxID=663243 RepID=UPI0008CA7C5F|nr:MULTISPECIES: NAD(P)H-hydrate dehydratase [unclassified Variovorax]SEK04089.1 yjeF C-terminal region, hydroxyethylthiazole kinase-related/yjeF N-terminal region [Variovorax sp. OK202]SFD38565.1 yjeF C-terminal region, hydroxyethylthiazole kinase-related/yjeF N-terminal region [Variovorax sp. OK212]